MSSAEEKPRGFAVSDRRAFTPEGEARPEGAPPAAKAEPPPAAAPSGEPPAESGPGSPAAPSPEERGARLPPVDFPTFVLSLGSSALMHLGELEHPGTGAVEQNLPMAKHTIDILSLLQEKTKGNLLEAEAKLLENLLYDLRLRYVELSRK